MMVFRRLKQYGCVRDAVMSRQRDLDSKTQTPIAGDFCIKISLTPDPTFSSSKRAQRCLMVAKSKHSEKEILMFHGTIIFRFLRPIILAIREGNININK